MNGHSVLGGSSYVVAVMANQELAFILDAALAEITRPHPCDEPVRPIVRDALRQLGLECDESTPRAALVAQVWARKRRVAPARGAPA